LTFKALTDVVKAQGETLRDLERQMPTKVKLFLQADYFKIQGK